MTDLEVEAGGRSSFRVSRRAIGAGLGPAAFLVVLLAPAPAGLDPEGQAAAAVALWMVTWWLTEAAPLPVTALLPIVLFPATGVLSAPQATAPYGSEVIFLFLGGFILAIAVQKWGLHRRLALWLLALVGERPASLLMGFMAATALVSMWMSNTAAAVMMLPVGIAAAATAINPGQPRADAEGTEGSVAEPSRRIALALMLGIAYAASLGGLATIIGSPPNAILVGYASRVMNEEITFARWMSFGVPVALAALAIAWLYLVVVVMGRDARAARLGRSALPGLTHWTPAEVRVLAVFLVVAALWVSRGALADPIDALGLFEVTDAGIAVAGAILLFLVPAAGSSGPRLLEWRDLRDLPWGILVLFGGGLALAAGMEASGLAAWIASGVDGLTAVAALLAILVVIAVVISLTEVMSNTAAATVFIPIAAAVGATFDLHPLVLAVAVTTAASCAFMLPVATPPNAVVFASGQVTLTQMARAGLAMNLLLALLLAVAVRWLLPLVWGLG